MRSCKKTSKCVCVCVRDILMMIDYWFIILRGDLLKLPSFCALQITYVTSDGKVHTFNIPRILFEVFYYYNYYYY